MVKELPSLRTRHKASIYTLFFFFGRIVWHVELPLPGIEPMPPAVEAWNLNHWTTREIPRQVYIFLTFLCLILLEGLANEIWQEKEITGIKTGKEEIELSLFTYIFVCAENLKACIKAYMSLSRSQDTKSTYKNQPYFYSTAINK